jgi:predicted ATPase/DNA-binding SARP family transcriptional activator/DNA-binding CsgD family transcriptional regulator
MQAQAEHERRATSTPERGGALETLRVWLLGDFRVSVGSRSIGEQEWHLRKAASLLKLLSLAPEHRLHREQVMELLWPDFDPEAALNNLHYALHIARRTLEPSALVSSAASRYLHLRGERLVLCPDSPLWVDVEAFEEAAVTARHALEPVAFRAALDLYAGELLPQDRYEPWAEERRAELGGLYLSLLLEMAGLYEERKEFEPAIEALSRMVTVEPTHEGARVGLMRLYAILGRRLEALRQYEKLKEALLRELDAKPTEDSRRLYEQIVMGQLRHVYPSQEEHLPEKLRGNHPHNLPEALTSFVGRRTELVKVRRALAMSRLLTLTGAGGCGKTRLALEVTRDLVGVYPDGVWLVELAGLSEPELVPQQVADALAVREQPSCPFLSTLLEELQTKKLLVVLDNCEHLVDACAQLVETLLGSCPDLRVLATSREALGVSGEVTWRVSSLSLPENEQLTDAKQLTHCESVRLFIDRACYRDPAFVLNSQNAPAVARICRQLDGIPLGIELAAARVGALSVEQMALRLADPLKLLSAGRRTASQRHKTLKGMLDWSYGLLSEPERKMFCRLSVFAGGWTLEAAEAVGAGSGMDKEDVLDLLLRLVDKSMVIAETTVDGEVRYRLLEPVRQYGRKCLKESGEADAVLNRHVTFFFALAQKAEPELRKAQQEAWAERLKREYENIRAALSWVIESGQTELALQLTKALGPFWYLRGFLREGQRWLKAALANKDAVPVSIRAKGLSTSAFIAFHQGDYKRTIALCEEVLALPREMVDIADVAAMLTNLGLTTLIQSDYERSAALLEEAAPLWRQIGDKVGTVRTLYCLGLVAAFRGDHGKATALHEEGLSLAWEVGDKVGIAWSLAQGALAALSRGGYEQAKALCIEGIELTRQTGYSHSTIFILRILAALASAHGQPVRSGRLWGMAETLGESIGVAVTPIEQQYYRPYIAAARSQLDEAAWEAAWAKGKAMTQEEAIQYALSEKAPTLSPESEEVPAGVREERITRRQQEIAVLLSRGLTNRQIAKDLVISKRTVDKHVFNILRKLGLHSRSQIAAWVTMQQLPPLS